MSIWGGVVYCICSWNCIWWGCYNVCSSYKYRCPFLYWMLNYLHSTDAIQSVVMQLSGTSKQVWRSLLRDPIPWQWAQAVVKLALPRVRGYLSLPLIRPHFIHIWKLWYCGSAPPKAWCRLSINSCASFPRIPGLFDAHGIQLAQSWTVSQIPLIARTCERSIANSQWGGGFLGTNVTIPWNCPLHSMAF